MAVLEKFLRRTPTSKRLHELASQVSPGGTMAGIKHFDPYPVFMDRANGSHIWDADGNEYVDYLMSYGALILGHGNVVLRNAIASTLDDVGTTVTGTPTRLESEYGEVLRGIYQPDGMIRFTNSGLEATMLAVRLAKAGTGRRKVAKFEGHYHGAVEELLFSYRPGPRDVGSSPKPAADTAELNPASLSNAVALPFNDWEGTEKLLAKNSKELACVIMEPFEEGVIPGDATFMKNLRKITSDFSIPLIFDEVKTGFRVRIGGASEYYSITPDLTCLGKIIGGGIPVGAVLGKEELLRRLHPLASQDERVFHSGTFNGNPLSLSAGMATVDEIRKRGNFDKLRRITDALKSQVSAELASRGVPHAMLGEGAMFNYYLTGGQVRDYWDVQSSDLKLRRLIDMSLLCEGVYLKPENRFCTSLAHTNEDLKLTETGFEKALDSLDLAAD